MLLSPILEVGGRTRLTHRVGAVASCAREPRPRGKPLDPHLARPVHVQPARRGFGARRDRIAGPRRADGARESGDRSEEHTSELQSLAYLVCRLLLEKK